LTKGAIVETGLMPDGQFYAEVLAADGSIVEGIGPTRDLALYQAQENRRRYDREDRLSRIRYLDEIRAERRSETTWLRLRGIRPSDGAA
jgi:hypothetical protein